MSKKKITGEDGKEYVVKEKKPWYKKWWIWVLAIIVIIFLLSMFGSSDDDSSTTSSTTSSKNSRTSSSKNSSTASSETSNSEKSESTDKDDDTGSASSYNATEGENNAEKYTYGDFVKSDDWAGKSYHISKAEVLQADEDDGKTTLLVYTDDDSDHLYMIAYDGKTDAVEDDYVDVQGVFTKRQSYDTKIGGSNTVPALVAKKITVVGKDSDN